MYSHQAYSQNFWQLDLTSSAAWSVETQSLEVNDTHAVHLLM